MHSRTAPEGVHFQVEARVVCTAQGPFGLKGMIEGIMADQSAASVKKYIAFCSRRCQAKLVKITFLDTLVHGSWDDESDEDHI